VLQYATGTPSSGVRAVLTARVSLPLEWAAVPLSVPFSNASLLSITKLFVATARAALGTTNRPSIQVVQRFIAFPYGLRG
jgi:hypothetical protein